MEKYIKKTIYNSHIKAIKEALADDTLSAKGRKAWTKVLEDAEQTLKNEHKEK